MNTERPPLHLLVTQRMEIYIGIAYIRHTEFICVGFAASTSYSS